MSEITYSTTAEIGIAALARAASAVFQDLPYEHEPFPVPPPEDFAGNYRVYDADLVHSVVALDGGQIVGIAVLARRGDRAYLVDFGVAPEFRRRGIGRRLMEVFLEEARRTGARTVELAADAGKTANPAVRLYEGAGLRSVRKLIALQVSAVASGAGRGGRGRGRASATGGCRPRGSHRSPAGPGSASRPSRPPPAAGSRPVRDRDHPGDGSRSVRALRAPSPPARAAAAPLGGGGRAAAGRLPLLGQR